jgi:hypothetical protein
MRMAGLPKVVAPVFDYILNVVNKGWYIQNYLHHYCSFRGPGIGIILRYGDSESLVSSVLYNCLLF